MKRPPRQTQAMRQHRVLGRFQIRAPVSWGQPQAVSSRGPLLGSHCLDIENKRPGHAISTYGHVFGESIFRTPRHKKCCTS